MNVKKTEWKKDILVLASLEKAWDIIYNVQLLPFYHPQVKSVEVISGGGKRCLNALYKYHDFNNKGWCTEKVIELETHKRIVMRIVEDSEGLDKVFKDSTLEFSFEQISEFETALKFKIYFFPIGLKGKIFEMLFGKRMRKTIEFAMQSIKNFVETYQQSLPEA